MPCRGTGSGNNVHLMSMGKTVTQRKKKIFGRTKLTGRSKLATKHVLPELPL